MVYLPSFAFLLVGVVAVAEANFSKPPVCKMTGDAYPPSMKPLPTGEPKNITTFVVDLDEPAGTRWNHVVAPFKAQIKNLTEVIINVLQKIFGKNVVKKVLEELRTSLPQYYKRLPEDFGEELAGIVRATGIDPSIIFIYNIFYTVFGACTSIVAQDSEGSIYHARNLDFGIWFDDNLDLGLVEWFDLKKPTSRLEVTMLCRQVLQSKNSGVNYRKALEAINNTGVIGPAYIIVSGAAKPFASDGNTVNLWTLDEVIAENRSYFLVQTNYGRDRFDFKGLYNVLEAKPNLNDLTAYTTLMHSATSEFISYREF
eukprot:gene12178-17193_t